MPNCKFHQDEQVSMYCEEGPFCRELICTICHASKHVGHKCTTIEKAAQGFVEKIMGFHVGLDAKAAETESKLNQLETIRKKVLEMLSHSERTLEQEEEIMIRLIKADFEKIWIKLSLIKEGQHHGMNKREEELKKELLALQDFKRTSTELIKKGSACDICQAGQHLLYTATDLAKTQTRTISTSNLDRRKLKTMSENKKKGDSCIQETKDKLGNEKKTSPLAQAKGKNAKIAGPARTISTSNLDRQKLQTMSENKKKGDSCIQETNDKSGNKKKTSPLAQAKGKYAKIAGPARTTSTSNLDRRKLQTMSENKKKGDSCIQETKDKSENEKKTSPLAQVKGKNATMADTDNETILNLARKLKQMDDPVTDSEKRMEQAEKISNKLLKEYNSIAPSFLAQPPVVHIIPGKGSVYGVGVIGREVFIARDGATHIEIYDVNNLTTTHRLLKISDETLSLPRMAACSLYKCLYVRHCNRSTSETIIYRVEVSDGTVTYWTVKKDSEGLSITKFHDLLMTLRHWKRIQRFTTHFHLIGEIIPDESFGGPIHCIQLSDGNFVVQGYNLGQPEVCKMDGRGKILKKSCLIRESQAISKDIGRDTFNLDYHLSCHLAVDSSDHVFVSDLYHNRVLLLSPTLALIGTVQTPGHDLNCPLALHFDEMGRRLYIGEGKSGNVVVVEVNPRDWERGWDEERSRMRQALIYRNVRRQYIE